MQTRQHVLIFPLA